MANWTPIELDQPLEPGQTRCTNVAGREMLICKTEHGYHAFDNDCPHAGMPLTDGDVTGCVITCPYHGYAYDIRDGRNVDFPDDVPLTTYPIRVEGDKIEVDVS